MSTPPPLPNRTPQSVTKPSGFNYLTLVSRVVVGGLLVASVWLLWWSYYRIYLPHLKEPAELNASVAKLTGTADDLDHQWSKADIEQINKKFAGVQPQMFTDQLELESWLADLTGQFTAQGMDIKTDIKAGPVGVAGTNAPAGAVPRFLVIPVTLAVTFHSGPDAAGLPPPGQRLLHLVQRLTTQEKSAVLTDLSLSSGTNSIDQAVLGFNFWAGAKEAK
jgi:hypothetical protein